MNEACKEARLLATCELHDSITTRETAALHEHLEGCESCQSWVGDVHTAQLLFDAHPSAPVPIRSYARLRWLPAAVALLLAMIWLAQLSPQGDPALEIEAKEHYATCELLLSQARHINPDRARIDLTLLRQELDTSSLESRTADLLRRLPKGETRRRVESLHAQLAVLRESCSMTDVAQATDLIRQGLVEPDTKLARLGAAARPASVEYDLDAFPGAASRAAVSLFAQGRAALYSRDYAGALASFKAAAKQGDPYYEDALYWVSYCSAELRQFSEGIDYALRSAQGHWAGPETARVIQRLCADAGAIIGERSARESTLDEVIGVLDQKFLQLEPIGGVFILGGLDNTLLRARREIRRALSEGQVSAEEAKEKVAELSRKVRAMVIEAHP